mgnify:CR=1 FL=1
MDGQIGIGAQIQTALTTAGGGGATATHNAQWARWAAEAGEVLEFTLPLPSGGAALEARFLADGDEAGFVFAGFLPAKAGERSARVQALAQEPRAVVLLEAPHRIADLAQALAVLGARPVTVGRELTKQFEQVHTGPCEALAGWLAEDAQRLRGEFALVLHPWPQAQPADDGLSLLQLLLEELPVKTAVRIAAQASGARAFFRSPASAWTLADSRAARSA